MVRKIIESVAFELGLGAGAGARGHWGRGTIYTGECGKGTPPGEASFHRLSSLQHPKFVTTGAVRVDFWETAAS